MPIFEIEAHGRQFELDAPDMASATAALKRHLEPSMSETAGKTGEPTWGDYAGGLARQAAQGLTFGFADEAEAGLRSLGGADYSEAVERIRGENQAFAEENPIASLAANVAGGVVPFVAGPGAALARAAVAAPRMLGPTGNVARSAGLGAGTGAVAGAGAAEGDLGDRAGGAAAGAAFGAGAGAVAAPAAAGVGRVLDRVTGRNQAQGPRNITGGQQAVLAAERIGVDVPRAMATDSHTLQTLGGATRALPYGSPLEAATNRTAQQLGQAADNMATGLGGGAPQDAFGAGSTAGQTLTDWMRRGVQHESGRNYDALRNLVNQNTLLPLSNTRQLRATLTMRDVQSATHDGERILALVDEALNRPQGLNWQGLSDLRTAIGERVSGSIAPEPGVSARMMRQMYSALTDDMRHGVQRAGIARSGSSGRRALAAWEEANTEHARLMGIRDRLVSIVGTDGSAPAELVFERLARMAGVGGNADLTRLAQARDVIQRTRPGAWEEVSSAIISRMGRNRADEFTPGRFLTAYGRMSPQGRDLVFGANTAHRQALDDIATVSQRFEDTISRYANPSGTGRAVGSIAGVFGAVTAPWTAIQTAAGGYGLAWMLSRPVTADAVRRYMQASLQAVTRPSPATAVLMQQVTRNLTQAVQQESDGAQTGVASTP